MTQAKYDIISDIDIPEQMVKSWQATIDILAKVLNVPSGLIMRVHPHEIEVFIRSDSAGNVYEPQEKANLDTGLYCETVMDTKAPLLVPNALKDEHWKNNPDVELNMISYLGVPLLWPDGEVFGTVCVLDTKENSYSELYLELLIQFKNSVQLSLESLFENKKLLSLQTQLVQSAKLASLGEMSACLAHELNQPLAVIGMTAEMALEAINEGRPSALDTAKIQLERIDKQVDRCSEIINHLRTFSGNDLNGKRKLSDINWLVNEALLLFKEMVRTENLQLSLKLDSNLPKVACDFIQIEQVLTNIISNACYALSMMKSEHPPTLLISSYSDEEFVHIAFEDNAGGINPEKIAKIFDPFYTTKPPGKGTGLGLSISHGIIEDHQGQLSVENTQSGCIFTVSLPITAP